jgi:hypothetical protein
MPFLLTTEHPSQKSFTEERTFIPRVCCWRAGVDDDGMDSAWLALQQGHVDECDEVAAAAAAGLFAIEDMAAVLEASGAGRTIRRDCLEARWRSMVDDDECVATSAVLYVCDDVDGVEQV